MGVGKVVSCSHGPSNIVWSENGPCCGTIAFFVGMKRKERIWFKKICLNLYKFERTTWRCLSLLKSALQFVMFEKILKVTVSRNLRQTHLLEVDLTKTPGDHKTLSTIRHVGFHVDIHPWSLLFSLQAFTWNELGRSPPFRPMRALRLQWWSRAFSLVCEMALDFMHHHQLQRKLRPSSSLPPLQRKLRRLYFTFLHLPNQTHGEHDHDSGSFLMLQHYSINNNPS